MRKFYSIDDIERKKRKQNWNFHLLWRSNLKWSRNCAKFPLFLHCHYNTETPSPLKVKFEMRQKLCQIVLSALLLLLVQFQNWDQKSNILHLLQSKVKRFFCICKKNLKLIPTLLYFHWAYHIFDCLGCNPIDFKGIPFKCQGAQGSKFRSRVLYLLLCLVLSNVFASSSSPVNIFEGCLPFEAIWSHFISLPPNLACWHLQEKDFTFSQKCNELRSAHTDIVNWKKSLLYGATLTYHGTSFKRDAPLNSMDQNLYLVT